MNIVWLVEWHEDNSRCMEAFRDDESALTFIAEHVAKKPKLLKVALRGPAFCGQTSVAVDLLEACIEARVWMLGRDGADRHLSMLDAAIAKATGDLDDPSTAWSGRAELAPGFSPMCLAPLDGTPVMLYMPTTGEKFAVGQWHGSPNSLHGNWGDDEGNYYVHEPVCFMALSNLERLVQPSYKATGEQA